jgi:ribonuclease P protein component
MTCGQLTRLWFTRSGWESARVRRSLSPSSRGAPMRSIHAVDAECCPRSGDRREAYLSTKRPSSCQDARLPRPHEHSRRPGRSQGSPRQGSRPPVGLIDSIRDRDVFVRLGRDGVRFRRGPLWCTYLADPAVARAHVAFAIGRPVGAAVVRNRLRRRLRMIVRQHPLEPGWWLIGARPPAVELTFARLEDTMCELAERVAADRRAVS